MNVGRCDFPELGWISERNFIGIEEQAGRKFLVFRNHEPKPSISAASTMTPDTGLAMEAYLDAETRLPVIFRNSAGTHNYQYDTPPTEMLSLPSEVKSALDLEQTRIRQLSLKPPAG